MALYDVDKTGQDRDAPRPNESDALPEGTRMAHGTHSTTYKVNDASGRVLRQRQISAGDNVFSATSVSFTLACSCALASSA